MSRVASFAAVFLLAAPAAAAQSDVAEVPHEDLRVGKDEHRRWFYVPAEAKKPPRRGFKLVVVLPGGTGAASFLNFVKRMRKHAFGDDVVVAQLVAPAFSEKQAKALVWPTEASRRKYPEVKSFTTEAFVRDVVEAAGRKTRIDARHVYVLGWSSGGPPAYAATLTKGTGVTGAFVAMSVFHPKTLPPLRNAKGKPFFLLHSPDDWIDIAHAEKARDALAEAGARTRLLTYGGGHGWRGDVYGNLKKGLSWLVEQNGRRRGRRR